jgi:hypothetical protein
LRANTRKVLGTLESPSEIRENFFRGEFSIGDIVTEDNNKYEIIDKRSNYVVIINESGQTKRRFVDTLTKISEDMTYPEDSFKGIPVTDQKLFGPIIESYENGEFKDAFGIVKALGLYEKTPESSIELIESFGFDVIIESSKEEQLQAVKIIADVLNITSNESDPNKLLQLVLKKSKITKISQDQSKILTDMLGLLKKIGLDTNLKEDCEKNNPNDDELEKEVLGYKKFKDRLAAHSGEKTEDHLLGNPGHTIANHSSDGHRRLIAKKLMGI